MSAEFKNKLLCLARFLNGSAAKPTPENISDAEDLRIMTECHRCIHRRNVPGNSHIECVKPDADMTGDPHGIRNGWFMYPLLFDPTWKTKACSSFEAVQNDAVSPAISAPVSRAS